MGRFSYDGNIKVEFDDRTLAHLQAVIVNKLRRSEPFQFTWRDETSMGGGRTSIWINAQSSLTYKFVGARQVPLNPAWLEALAYTANSPAGLHIVPEPIAHASDETVDET